MTILDVNLQVKNQIHQLYRRDEQRIIAEYQQVFELERDVPVDVVLSSELAEFKQAVERFESQLQGENLKLQDLVELRRKVRDLLPKLKPADDRHGADAAGQAARAARKRARDRNPAARRGAGFGRRRGLRRGVLQADRPRARRHQPDARPQTGGAAADIFGPNLGPREVVAYRRLYGGGTCDRGLETFVLQAAGLRARIEHEVDEIKGILDDSAITREAPVYKVGPGHLPEGRSCCCGASSTTSRSTCSKATPRKPASCRSPGCG